MVGTVGSFISCYACTILIAGRLLNRQEYFKLKNFIIILIAIPFLKIDDSLTMIYKIILVIIIYTIIIKLIYKKGIIISFIVCIFAYSVGLLCDVINSFIYLIIFNMDISYIRQHLHMIYIMHFSFFAVALTISLLIKPKSYFDKVEDFILKKNLTSVIQYIVFFILFTGLLGYIISVQPYLSRQHIMSVVLLILFIIMNITYFAQIKISAKSKYDYDNIYNYTGEIERTAKQLSRQEHEYKNRLMGIQALVESGQREEAVKFINDIISTQKNNGELMSANYDRIYDAVLKKLLIEKTNKAVDSEIKINADVRKDIPNINISKIVLNDAISIILDNAIEAADKSAEKAIDIMIDTDEDEISVIVANTYSKAIEEAAIYRDGVSSNEGFRGNGLYILKQIEDNNPNITIDTTITEELFIA